jgi:hypothetical protein
VRVAAVQRAPGYLDRTTTIDLVVDYVGETSGLGADADDRQQSSTAEFDDR